MPTLVSVLLCALWNVSLAQVVAPNPKYVVEKPVKRLALVIANWDYPAGRLEGTDNDQKLLSDQLLALGFEVSTFSNFRTQEELANEALNPFLEKITFGDFAIIYYSGHGMSFGSESYLVPTRLPGEIQESEFFNHFISVEELQRKMTGRQAGISLVMLDACRTFQRPHIKASDGTDKEIPKGLVRPSIRMSTNMALAYAAAPGYEAIVKGKASIFTESLVEELASGIDEYNEIKRNVANRVLNKSNDKQEPWFSESATAVIRFRETVHTKRTDRVAWEISLQRGTIEAIKTYLRSFPTSRYAFAAREWLRDNPAGVAIASAAVPPMVVAEIWKQSQGQALLNVDISSHFRYPKRAVETTASVVAAGAVFDAQRASTAMTSRAAADWMMAANAVIAAKPTQLRNGPTSASQLVTTVPRNAVIALDGGTVRNKGKTWLSARVDSVDGPVYLEVPPVQAKPAQLRIGMPLVEGFVQPNPGANSALVREVDVYKLIASAGNGASSISWASVETGKLDCKAESAACQRLRDLQVLQTLHVESLLAQAGIDRAKVTTLMGRDDVPKDKIRIRFFTGDKFVHK